MVRRKSGVEAFLSKRCWSVCLLIAAAAMLLSARPAFSQSSTSSIRGTLTDSTGGVVPNAGVTVLDVARGIARDLTTDAAGQYLASNIIPGAYTVRATAAGFRTIERTGIIVEVGQNVRVDLVLQPGEQTQTVTVTEEIPFINTTDAQLGGTITNLQINELPLNGRNYYRLLQLRPGIVTAIGTGTGNNQYTNGRKQGDDLFRVEGIATIAQTAGHAGVLNAGYRSGDSGSLLPLDAVTEFNTATMPKAEDGWKEGSVISLGIKSGTNTLHGTAYAFGRNARATDARNYFDTTGKPTPATLEQFGGSAGGAIIKDKLFWFAAYEGLRDNLTGLNNITIPTSTATGDPTTSMVDACLALKAAGKSINPLSAQLAGLNPATCVVTPASPTFENLFPYNATGSTNWLPALNTTGPLDNGIFKGDYAPSPNHHLAGMFFRSRATQIANTDIGQLRPEWRNTVIPRTDAFTASWTWIINPSVVNDLRTGMAYFKNETGILDGDKNPADPWPKGYGINTGVTNPAYFGMPTITISGFTGFLGVGTNGPTIRGPEGNWSIVDTISYLHGKHAFKFGFEFVDIIWDEGLGGNIRTSTAGQINFSSLQNFLAGTVQTAQILLGDNTNNFRQHWYSGFMQDDWRLTPRLTLNLGLRYEFKGPPFETHNFFGNFNPNVPPGTPAVQAVGPGAPIRNFFEPIYNEWSPRVGVAWDIEGNGRTVLRAAANLLRDFVPLNNIIKATPFAANYPDLGVNTSGTIQNLKTVNDARFSASQINWSLAGPVFPVSNTQVINGVTYTGLSCTAARPCTVSNAMDPNFKYPRAAEWSLDLQRAITHGLGVDIAYVGNYGYKEQFLAQLNMPRLGAGWTPTAINNCINSAPLYNNCKVDATKEVGQYTTQFPYFNFISQSRAGSSSNYHALQVTGNMRAYHGLSFLTAYTWAHSLGNQPAGTPYDPSNLSMYYGSGPADIRNRFSFSPTYQLPGIKSPGQILEGWSVNAILLSQGGTPWGPSDATNDIVGVGTPRNVGTPQQSWNFTGNPKDFRAGSQPIPCYGTMPGCISSLAAAPANIQTACMNAATAPYGGAGTTYGKLAIASLTNFGCYVRGSGILTPPAYGTLGNTNNSTFLGPSYTNVDFSVTKNWKFKERYGAQFRVEFFNVFNHPHLEESPVSTNPVTGPNGSFGCSCATPDGDVTHLNPVLGSGGPRHIQFGLKLSF